MIVLDASAAVELVLGSAAGRAVSRRVGDPRITLHAPHLLVLESAQVLRRLSSAGLLDEQRATLALHDLADLDLFTYEHEPLLPRIWELRADLTAYDAAYVALAEILDAPLLTFDQRISTSPGHRARVEVPDER